MLKRSIFVSALVFLLASVQSCRAETSRHQSGGADRVKKSVLAGSWYPADEYALKKMIDEFLSKAAPPSFGGKKIRALIVPHAGYQYSGQGAAFGYKLLEGTAYQRVLIMAPSHYGTFKGFSVPDYSAYETPLGRVEIDREAIDQLLSSGLYAGPQSVHEMEHSIEIQLPFLQRVLKDFKVIPILLGEIDAKSDIAELASLFLRLVDDRTIVIGSSDFTHYGERFGYLPFKFKKAPDRADIEGALKRLDMGAVDQIVGLNADGFVDYTDRTKITICGKNPIAVILKMFEGRNNMTATLLKYYTSIEATGDWSSSVSYATVAVWEKDSQPANKTDAGAVKKGDDKGMNLKEDYSLTKDEKANLLKIARDTLNMYLANGKYPDMKAYKITPSLEAKRGVFVTLTKHGDLRGCIGYIEGIKPVYEAVMENAVNAALEDPRFPHVTKDELPGLDIEISVMTPLTPVKDIGEIEVGKHGLVIAKGWNKGLLLPQVATEWKWNRTQFLEAVSSKAMLPRDAWKDKDAKLFKFAAIVFGEEKRK